MANRVSGSTPRRAATYSMVSPASSVTMVEAVGSACVPGSSNSWSTERRSGLRPGLRVSKVWTLIPAAAAMALAVSPSWTT